MRPEINLVGDLVTLDTALLDALALLRQRCAAQRDVGASSFTGVGRGGLPAGPEAALASAYDGAAAAASGGPGAAAASLRSGTQAATLLAAGCADGS